MKTEKRIAIVGATGNMGAAISKGLAKGNHSLILVSDDHEKANALRKEITANSKSDLKIADKLNVSEQNPEIIILAVPYSAEKELISVLKNASAGTIVISITNPINESFSALVTKPGKSAAEELQEALPDLKVVKAFNTTFAADFEKPVIDGKLVDAFVAGNDEASVETVSGLIKTVGFNPLVAGKLNVSGTLEQMQLLLMQLGMKNDYNWHAGWKILHN